MPRARVDLDKKLRDRLRKKAEDAEISLSEALQVAVDQVLQMNPRQLRALAREKTRKSRPEWWPHLCRELRRRRDRRIPITTREDGGAKNAIVKVSEPGGFIVLMSERSRTGQPRRLTVDDIDSTGTANEAIRDALRTLGERLLEEATRGRQ